jgi:iron complex outermembrane recepter protein
MSGSMNRLRFGLSMAAMAAATAFGSLAQAQEAATPTEPEADEEIVVTGFRGSLSKALDVKRDATGVVDAILAEDIADFPDLNLAESIQRIPGVSIDRDAGEGRSITVRGLGSDFTRTRVNGMEALATTGGTDSSGGANRSRQFDFNVFASELFNSIKVSKTPSAESEEGSLGATLDLTTARPFDYNEFTMAISAQMGWNDLSEENDPRAAFLISDTWFDGKLGALFSVAYANRSTLEDGFSSVRWEQGSASGGFCSPVGFDINPTTAGVQVSGGTTLGASSANCSTGIARPANTPQNIALFNAANNAFHPRLPRYGRLTHEQDRLGMTGSVQFKPFEATTITWDLLFAELKATRQEDFLESLSLSRTAAQGGKPQVIVRDAIVSPDGDLVYAVLDNVDVRSESRFDELETDFTQNTVKIEQEITDRLSATALIGRSESDFNNPVQTTVTLDRTNIQGYTIDFRGNDRLPLINYGFDVSNPANWGFLNSGQPGSEIRIRPQGATNIFDTVQLDLKYDVSDSLTLRGGANYKNFKFTTYEFRRGSETAVPALPPGTSVANISTVLNDYGQGLGQPAGTPTTWLIPSFDAVANLFNIYCNCDPTPGTAGDADDFRLTSITNGSARGNNRAINETDKGYYVQLDWNTDVAGFGVRGNVGVRQVNTELKSQGYLATGGGLLVTVKNEYEDTLPSLNVAVDVMEDVVFRFGAAKVMARPQLQNLNPGGTVSTTGTLTITTGNPLLEPFRATTYDTSVEWYFSDEGLFSVAFFYKDIDSYIQTIRQDRPFNTTGLPLSLLPVGFTGDEVFQVSAAINTPGGPLKGFEIGFQTPFDFLPGPFDRFGIQANYTYVESEILYATSATTLGTAFVKDDLVNLSPEAYNATLYYDHGPLEARVSVAYRDDYLQTVPGRNGNDVEGKIGTLNVDVSASYEVGDHLTFSFEGLNLTDEFNDQYVSSTADRPSVYHHTGRQYYVGVRYRY